MVAALDRKTLAGEITGDLGALGDALAGVPARWRPAGAATVSAALGGTFAAPRIDATIAATKLDAAGQRAESARAAVRLDGTTLTVESLELTQPGGGKLAASGTYGLDDERYTAKVQGTNLVVGPIPRRRGRPGAAARRFGGPALRGRRRAGPAIGDGRRGGAPARVGRAPRRGPGRVDVSLERGVATIDAAATDFRAKVQGTVSIPTPRRFTLRGEVAGPRPGAARALPRLDRRARDRRGRRSRRRRRATSITSTPPTPRSTFGGSRPTHGSDAIALVEPATVTYRDGVLTAGRIALRAGRHVDHGVGPAGAGHGGRAGGLRRSTAT